MQVSVAQHGGCDCYMQLSHLSQAPNSPACHCGILMPVAAMTSPHFLVSACIIASISSGELPATSRPCAVMRELNLGSATAFLSSCDSTSTTFLGVLAGASSPNQPVSS